MSSSSDDNTSKPSPCKKMKLEKFTDNIEFSEVNKTYSNSDVLMVRRYYILKLLLFITVLESFTSKHELCVEFRKCLYILQNTSDVDQTVPSDMSEKLDQPIVEKKPLKGVKYRTWNVNSIPPPIQKYKKPTEKEMTEVSNKSNNLNCSFFKLYVRVEVIRLISSLVSRKTKSSISVFTKTKNYVNVQDIKRIYTK